MGSSGPDYRRAPDDGFLTGYGERERSNRGSAPPEQGQAGPGPTTPLKPRRGPGACTICAEMVLMVLLPWMVFTGLLCCFGFTYNDYPVVSWVCAGVCALLSLLAMASGTVQGRQGTVRLAVGFLCFASVSVAATVGLFVNCEIMSEQWRIVNGPYYENVDPISKASGHADAAVINFLPNTFVDASRTIGYRQDGAIYCVAPVSVPTSPEATIQYWAVGEDCCEQRTNFLCDDARKTSVRSAIVACESCNKEQYRKAISEAMHAYPETKSDPGALLLKWTEDPALVAEELYKTGTAVILIASVVQFFASFAAALLLTAGKRR